MKINTLLKRLLPAIIMIAMIPTLGSAAPNQKLSLELEAVSIQTVLGMISEQYGLNIVVNAEVTGEVSLKLKEVDLNTALSAILYPNGYNYYTDDGVIVVKSLESQTTAELTTEVITLKYADAAMVQKALEALKTDRGSVVLLDPTIDGQVANVQKFTPNRLLMTDYPQVVDQMKRIIVDLDVAERLISIEVKLIETTVDDQSKLGFTWPTLMTGQISSGDISSSSSTSTSDQGDGFLGSMPLESGQWTWGTLSVSEVRTVLDALSEKGNSRLLSDPRITTVENREAVIKSQTVIPIQTINRFSEAAATSDIVTFVDEEVGISLRVTARINEDDKITLDVMPIVEDIIGYTGTAENSKPITSERSINTRITVRAGETAALGGLLKESEIIKERKVPLLGQIPLLGSALFSHRQTQKTTTDLLILITPILMP
ncbi:MAG: hypothetical protein P1R58_04525 [bacterium]|nr:hypothetical protein [bacterium]